MSRKLGIMQGRLVPPAAGRIQAFPRERWVDEFGLAREAGVAAIEWIFDDYGRDVNPLSTAEGIERLQREITKSGVSVDSLVADYFMDYPFVGVELAAQRERRDVLAWLIQQSAQIGITRIVLPFVD